MRTLFAFALAASLLMACPGDEPPMVCPAIPFDCANACCTTIVPGDYVDCAQVCPGGFTAIAPGSMCAPAPECPDAGPDSGVRDAGRSDGGLRDAAPIDGGGCPDLPLPSCFGGPCCDVGEPARRDPITCEAFCPRGLSFDCRPSPLCMGGSRCTQPSECVVTHEGCCEPCVEPTLDDVIGIAADDVDEYYATVCADPVACPDCIPAAPNPDLVAACNARACVAVDVTRLPATRCTVDDDCRVRTNTCCECDAEPVFENLIGITPLGVLDLLNLVCDSDATCEPCTPDYPADAEAYCNAGRCDVRRIP